jgi:hypothetical protein
LHLELKNPKETLSHSLSLVVGGEQKWLDQGFLGFYTSFSSFFFLSFERIITSCTLWLFGPIVQTVMTTFLKLHHLFYNIVRTFWCGTVGTIPMTIFVKFEIQVFWKTKVFSYFNLDVLNSLKLLWVFLENCQY